MTVQTDLGGGSFGEAKRQSTPPWHCIFHTHPSQATTSIILAFLRDMQICSPLCVIRRSKPPRILHLLASGQRRVAESSQARAELLGQPCSCRGTHRCRRRGERQVANSPVASARCSGGRQRTIPAIAGSAKPEAHRRNRRRWWSASRWKRREIVETAGC